LLQLGYDPLPYWQD